MKNLKSRAIWIIGFAALLIMSMPILAMAKEAEYVPALFGSVWSLLPPFVAIILALITKEAYSSLFIGIVCGGILWSGGHFEQTVHHVLADGIISRLSDSYNVGILVFLIILGSLVAMMNKTGASAAFGAWAEERIKTREGAQYSTILLGCLIFVDDYFNCLTVGAVMRPITDKHHVSRAKLAYLIDATAAPVCIIAPISSWAAAVAGFVPGEDGFSLFVRCIPYNFYALLTILMMVCIVAFHFDYGPMRVHEDNAINGDIYTTPDRPYENAQSDAIEGKGKVIDMVLPVLILIAFCIGGILYAGGFFKGTGFVQSFSSTDASVGLSTGSLLAILVCVAWFLGRRLISFKDIMDCFPEGFKAMIPANMILTLAWTLKAMTDSLGSKEFVQDFVGGLAGSLVNLLPAVVFLIGCVIAFATGTSWGTFGILIPIVVSVFSNDKEMMVIAMSACMAGAVCGDHCSPISDTTIMASAGAQSNHINHVNTQLPDAMTVAAVSFVAYIIAGFVKNVFIALPVAFAMMIAVLAVLVKIYGKESE